MAGGPVDREGDGQAGLVAGLEQSFFALLKAEIGTRHRPDRATARAEIFAFIETFHNRKRLRKHPLRGYLTPLKVGQGHEQGHAHAA